MSEPHAEPADDAADTRGTRGTRGTGHATHVVVHPVETDPQAGPFRRVDILTAHVGKAYGLADVLEFLRRAGLDEDAVDAPGLIEWQGGDAGVWE
jgi:hypothetical protein